MLLWFCREMKDFIDISGKVKVQSQLTQGSIGVDPSVLG